MQPYLQPQKPGSVLVGHRKENGTSDLSAGEPNHALMAAAEDLIRAVHSKDAKAVADALEAASYACESDDRADASTFGEND